MLAHYKKYCCSSLIVLTLSFTLSACGGSSGAASDQIRIVNGDISGDTPDGSNGNQGGNGGQNGGNNNGGNDGANSGGDNGGNNGGNNGRNNGGDGDGGNGNPPSDDPMAPAVPRLSAACAVEDCAAASANWYAGSGTGVWRYKNAGSSEVALPMEIGGLKSTSVLSLIFTNEDSQAKALPAGAKVPQAQDNPVPANRSLLPCQQQEGTWIQRGQFAPVPGEPVMTVAYPFCTNKVRSITAHDGRTVDFWVEQGENTDSRISNTLIDTLSRRFALDSGANVYDAVTAITGAPWGITSNSSYISDTPNGNAAPTPLALNIVFVNTLTERFGPGKHNVQLNPDNLKRSVLLDQGEISAGKLSIFIDSAALYSNPAFLRLNEDDTTSVDEVPATEYLKSELARELGRLAMFYQRTLAPQRSQRYTLPPWLEDLAANMLQYTVDNKLGSVTLNNGLKVSRNGVALPLAAWFNSPSSCDQLLRPAAAPQTGYCNSDSASVAFSVYLMNQYGAGLLSRLLAVETTSTEIDYVALLDRRIRQSGGPGFTGSLWRHGTSLGLLGNDVPPPRFGLPAYLDQTYPFPAQNLAGLNRVAQLPVLKEDIPSSVAAYGQVAAKRLFSDTLYRETVQVPPGVSVVVVVQDGL